MKFLSEIVTSASGSIGGATYSRAKGGGMYRRARAIPTNPSTGLQAQVKTAMQLLVNNWLNVLTQGQRSLWDLYGSEVPTTDKLGQTLTLSGQNWYIACNVPRLQVLFKFGLTIAAVNTPPQIFNRGDLDTVTTAYDETTGLELTTADGQDWEAEDDSWLLVYQGRPQNASRTFFKGPYRLVGAFEGDTATPTTGPFQVTAADLVTNGYAVTAGQRYSTAVAVTRADGRLTTRQLIQGVIAT